MATPRFRLWRRSTGVIALDPQAPELTTNLSQETLLAVLVELLDMKQEAFRDLGRALVVARDTLQPLADNKPLSGPAQRALVTMALMSLSQASAALDELAAMSESSNDIKAGRGMR